MSLEAIGVRVTDLGITHVVCLTVAGKVRMYSLANIIAFINGGNSVYTDIGRGRVPVYVVNGPVRRAYVRTKANQSVADNLLSLPRY